jgi:hypothetical protein
MDKNNSLPLEYWRQIFINVCYQIESAEIDSSADRLNIIIKGRNEALQATHNELDEAFLKFSNNVKKVVHSFMKNHGVIVIYQNTLVGYFDIQAYSAFIDDSEKSFKEKIWKINELFHNISSKTDALDVKIDFWILSDSIIVVVDTERSCLFEGSIAFFLGTCSVLMADAIRHGFPLRGAIGGGDFFKDGELMVSSALVDAVRYEKEQNWLGAVLTPTAKALVDKALEQVKEVEIKLKGKTDIDFLLDRFKPFIKCGKIHWKSGNNITKPCHSWYYIKPYHMTEKNWATKYLPSYFQDKDGKITNSDCLYGQE